MATIDFKATIVATAVPHDPEVLRVNLCSLPISKSPAKFSQSQEEQALGALADKIESVSAGFCGLAKENRKSRKPPTWKAANLRS